MMWGYMGLHGLIRDNGDEMEIIMESVSGMFSRGHTGMGPVAGYAFPLKLLHMTLLRWPTPILHRKEGTGDRTYSA